MLSMMETSISHIGILNVIEHLKLNWNYNAEKKINEEGKTYFNFESHYKRKIYGFKEKEDPLKYLLVTINLCHYKIDVTTFWEKLEKKDFILLNFKIKNKIDIELAYIHLNFKQ